MNINVKYGADRELERRLRKLPGKAFTKVIRGANAKSMTPMARALRKAAPVKTGALKRSIGKSSRVFRDKGVVRTWVGVRAGWSDPKSGKRPEDYARFVEMKAPFAAAAAKAAAPQVHKDYRRITGEGIEKVARERA